MNLFNFIFLESLLYIPNNLKIKFQRNISSYKYKNFYFIISQTSTHIANLIYLLAKKGFKISNAIRIGTCGSTTLKLGEICSVEYTNIPGWILEKNKNMKYIFASKKLLNSFPYKKISVFSKDILFFKYAEEKHYDAVDLESAGLYYSCEKNNIPHLSINVVSDNNNRKISTPKKIKLIQKILNEVIRNVR